MNTATQSLRKIPALAAIYLREHGWTQGTEEDACGHVCLTGALRKCSPRPGDFYIAREVFRKRDRAEDWNDANERTDDQVVDYLANAEITDADLADTFGPQWSEIVAMVRTIAAATPEQLKSLATARGATLATARGATRGATRGAARATAWDATWGAAGALVTRDLIGTHGYTQEMYEKLTAPWVSVFGPLHPGDVTA